MNSVIIDLGNGNFGEYVLGKLDPIRRWKTEMKYKHKINEIIQAGVYLSLLCEKQTIMDAVNPVIKDERFYSWPASTSQHQVYNGGLLIHTAQVLSTALKMLEDIPDTRIEETIIAVIWHDYAKVLDYREYYSKQYLEGFLEPNKIKCWEKTEHCEKIRHLAKSYAMFYEHANKIGMDVEKREFISHLMLAHHGRKEWGSPVEPQCAEAWAIHAADYMSSDFVL